MQAPSLETHDQSTLRELQTTERRDSPRWIDAGQQD